MQVKRTDNKLIKRQYNLLHLHKFYSLFIYFPATFIIAHWFILFQNGWSCRILNTSISFEIGITRQQLLHHWVAEIPSFSTTQKSKSDDFYTTSWGGFLNLSFLIYFSIFSKVRDNQCRGGYSLFIYFKWLGFQKFSFIWRSCLYNTSFATLKYFTYSTRKWKIDYKIYQHICNSQKFTVAKFKKMPDYQCPQKNWKTESSQKLYYV